MSDDPAPLNAASRSYDRGKAHMAAGRPKQARTELSDALARIPSNPRSRDADRLRIRVMMSLAFVDFDLSGLVAADGWLKNALERAHTLAADDLLALCHSQRATVLGRSGRLDEALEATNQAVSMIDAMAALDQVVLRISEGMISSELGHFDRADRAFSSAATIAEAEKLDEHAFMARHNRGYVAALSGDLPLALRLMRDADQMKVDVSRGVARLDHGRVLLEAGLIIEAREMLESALSVSLTDDQHQVVAEIEMEAARANLLLGRLDPAATLARSARDRMADRNTGVWAGRCDLLLLQIISERVDVDGGTSASRHAERAHTIAESPAGRTDRALARDANLLAARMCLTSGESELAQRHLREATALDRALQSGSSLSARLDRSFVVAAVAAARQDVDGARDTLLDASQDLQTDQALGGSLDLRTAVSLHAKRLSSLDLRLARSDSPMALFTAAERWRAASLQLPGVRPAADPELAAALSKLRRLEARSTPQEEAALDEVAVARREVQHIARGLTLNAGHGSVPLTATLEETRATLSHHDAEMLQLIDHDGQLLALSVFDGDLDVRVLGTSNDIGNLARRVRADLAMAASRDLGVMGPAVRSSLRSGLEQLDEAIIAPVKTSLRRLVLVTSATTRALPWSMLPSLAGVPVTVAQSATQWTRGTPAGNERGSVVHPPRVTAIAGPDLRHAEAEVDRVAGVWPTSRILTGADATTQNVTRSLADSEIVHIAAHGIHERQNPLFAHLRLQDGPLYVHDLELQGVGAGHVVLSACDVGASTTRPGEEVLGLAAGLLALGAASVLAAVCRVGDEVAAQTMARYHQYLSAGEPSDIALAHAVAEGPPLAGAFGVFGSPWQAPVPH